MKRMQFIEIVRRYRGLVSSHDFIRAVSEGEIDLYYNQFGKDHHVTESDDFVVSLLCDSNIKKLNMLFLHDDVSSLLNENFKIPFEYINGEGDLLNCYVYTDDFEYNDLPRIHPVFSFVVPLTPNCSKARVKKADGFWVEEDYKDYGPVLFQMIKAAMISETNTVNLEIILDELNINILERKVSRMFRNKEIFNYMVQERGHARLIGIHKKYPNP